ncbi:hypothetical protein [Nocardioides terrisoli]|uniref:hypothetical protein n=1 Tax=Nocardioides terrisoli TaxID=3388267 RepID=UPI00287B9489|nr:hypothetical protein [Nocardioides marmorisolisilvae]
MTLVATDNSAGMARPSPLTVAELLATLADDSAPATWSPPRPIPAAQTSSANGPEPAALRSAADGQQVTVVGAEPGAGTSTIALAIAEALAQREGPPVELIDLAPTQRSGLICAADRELGTDRSGWSAGTRGNLTIRRAHPEEPLATPTAPCGPPARRVIDAASSTADADGLDASSASVVMVCRATVPGVRRAELALEQLPTTAVLAAIAPLGSRRWQGPVHASMGPRARRLAAAGQMVLVSGDRRLAISGIDSTPLPRSVLAAGARLADLLAAEPAESTRTNPSMKER